jgi:hypothetical protein
LRESLQRLPDTHYSANPGYIPLGPMRVGIAAAIVAVLLSAMPALAEDTRRAGVQDVIGAQLNAFQHDDAAAAFAFASQDIQAMFGSPANFMRMVAASYAPVYRSHAVTFLDQFRRHGRTVQRVLITGPEGKQVMALYFIARQADGTWRIAGCMLIDPAGEST